MKTLEDLKTQLQRSSSIEDAISIRIRMIELKRDLKKHDHSISPISDMLNRIYNEKKLVLKS
jgi:hypothetical protein